MSEEEVWGRGESEKEVIGEFIRGGNESNVIRGTVEAVKYQCHNEIGY